MSHDDAPLGGMADHFDSESEKLKTAIMDAQRDAGALPIQGTVGIYFQVISLTSYMTVLKDRLKNGTGSGVTALQDRIARMEGFIAAEFDGNLHPMIISKLTESIKEASENMRADRGQGTEEEIRGEAKQYEELREKMSVREFVVQYDKGLAHD